jgi:uncharacterized protein YdiU (UPF0061 family)
MLQEPLRAVIEPSDLAAGLAKFTEYYQAEYRHLMLKKLGFEQLSEPLADELLPLTIALLQSSQVGYHQFFYEMARTFSRKWRDEPAFVMDDSPIVPSVGTSAIFDNWCILYHQILNHFHPDHLEKIAQTLVKYNPQTALLRPLIESVWEEIALADNWQPFDDLVQRIQLKK